MIEKHRVLPVNFGVAVFTLCAQCFFVRIVVEMAGFAARLELNLKNRLDMTVVARHFLVQASERVVGVLTVIENRLGPFRTDMADVALATTVFVVFVIFKVARYALAIHLIVKRVVGMAVVASQFGMRSLQRKLGVTAMIKT